jgi:hypothetical protein
MARTQCAQCACKNARAWYAAGKRRSLIPAQGDECRKHVRYAYLLVVLIPGVFSFSSLSRLFSITTHYSLPLSIILYLLSYTHSHAFTQLLLHSPISPSSHTSHLCPSIHFLVPYHLVARMKRNWNGDVKLVTPHSLFFSDVFTYFSLRELCVWCTRVCAQWRNLVYADPRWRVIDTKKLQIGTEYV